MRSRDRRPSGTSLSRELRVTDRTRSLEEDTNHLQSTTPEWQFPSTPSPSSFHIFPAEQSIEGFVHRYPRVREFQSLNAILVQCFPENEGGNGPVPPEMARTCLALGSGKGWRYEAAVDESPEKPEPIPVRDDSYHVTSVSQVPLHYSFRGRNKERTSAAQKSPNDVSGNERSKNRHLGERLSKSKLNRGKGRNTPGTSSNDKGLHQASASRSGPMSPTSSITGLPKSWEDTEDLLDHLAGKDDSDWTELTKSIGPLPWPLENVNTDAFSSQPEFRPFLEPKSG